MPTPSSIFPTSLLFFSLTSLGLNIIIIINAILSVFLKYITHYEKRVLDILRPSKG